MTPIKNLKSNGLPGFNEIPAKFFVVEGKTLRCKMRELRNYVQNREELLCQWRNQLSFYFFSKNLIKQIVNITVIILAYEYICHKRRNKIVSYILPLVLIQDADKNTEYLQCSFRRENSADGQIFNTN